eukprot:TRINITY_DN53125_c0_g1_i1.p1 TRINITY_DN53125_c0_g1~~TRINITY_DN53125_c0_g1_i1.p1  ORF type:complete len:616 (-),score=63.67 TRINITY_DN53125_c0_g1_i1:172-1968(-)
MSRLVAPTLAIPSLGLGPRPVSTPSSGTSPPVQLSPWRTKRPGDEHGVISSPSEGAGSQQSQLHAASLAQGAVSAVKNSPRMQYGGFSSAFSVTSAPSSPGASRASHSQKETRPLPAMVAYSPAEPFQDPASHGRSASIPDSMQGSIKLAPQRKLGGEDLLGDLQGLGGALSTFGAPSEWWHDSIILGRLSALARRYSDTRTLKRPWQAWLWQLRRGRQKREACRKTHLQLAMRSWHYRTMVHGLRLRRKIPLIRAIMKLPQKTLNTAWGKFRQAVFLQRDVDRRLRLLHLVRQKMLNTMAQVHYHQTLLRLGLAALWLAAKTGESRRLTSPSPELSPEASSAQYYVSGRNQIQHVVGRAWRRWWFATRMWLSSSQYREREVEAWLAGECSTPRSMKLAEAWGSSVTQPGLTEPSPLLATPTPLLAPPKDFTSSLVQRASPAAGDSTFLNSTELPFPEATDEPLLLQGSASKVLEEFQFQRPRFRGTSVFRSSAEVGAGSSPNRRHQPGLEGETEAFTALAHDHERNLPAPIPSQQSSKASSDAEVSFVEPWMSGARRGSPSGALGLVDPPMPSERHSDYWAMRRSIQRPAVLGTRRR